MISLQKLFIMEIITLEWNTLIWEVFVLFSIVLMLYCLYDILTHSFKGNEKLVWILVLFLIPLVGPIFYLVLGKKRLMHFENKKDHVFFKKHLSPLNYIICFFLPFLVFSQDKPVSAQAALAEKVYLQLDSQVYTTSQTIWFKALVTSAANHRPSSLSGVLHVELISPDRRIIEKKLVKIKQGSGENFFELRDNYPQGKYLIRAYTHWNKNFSEDFIFRSYIDIFSSSTEETESAITNVNLIKKERGEYELEGLLKPRLIDSLHRKELDVYLSLDGNNDTLSLKENSAGTYDLNYEVPADIRRASISFKTNNDFHRTRVIALHEDTDLQFFPESGELVNGLMNKVGFKVSGPDGKGFKAKGKIIGQNGKLITSFESNRLGMGSFHIQADTSTTYFARLTSPREDPEEKYPLPTVVPKGNKLSLLKAQGNIRIEAFSNNHESDSIFINVSSRGINYYLIKSRLKNGRDLSIISPEKLPQGIIVFTMLDHKKRPLAERLFFNERRDKELKLNITADQTSYEKRGKTKLKVQVTNSKDQKVKANISVLVIDNSDMGRIQERRENILSYFLLSSEIRGIIEDPGYYFRETNKNSLKDIDALLLTQGWRKYNYRNPVGDSLSYSPETSLKVSGTVGGIFSRNKLKEGIGLTLLTFGKNSDIYTSKSDSTGHFRFNLDDYYGRNLNILVQSKNEAGKRKNYSVSLEEHKPPEVLYDDVEAIVKPDSTMINLAKKQQEKQMTEEAFKLATGVTELEEVHIDAYNLTPQRKEMMETYGKPDIVIDGDKIREKEEKWSYGLYSVLLFNFPEGLNIDGGFEGPLRASVLEGGNNRETLVVIDGIPVQGHDYHLIPNISPSEVRSVEIIKFAQRFQQLYREVYPDNLTAELPTEGSIIAIYTYGGKGIFGTNSPKGTLHTSIPIFSPSKEFYAPNYQTITEERQEKPDLRSLIHWEPQLKTNERGNVKSHYFNSDGNGKIMIVVEAISENGEIGYRELIYEVKK